MMFLGWRQGLLDGTFDEHDVSGPLLRQYRRWESEMGLHPALDRSGVEVEYTLDHDTGEIRRREIMPLERLLASGE